MWQNFINVFVIINGVINILALIWVAAVKLTRLEVKVEPIWQWFIEKNKNK